MTKTAPRPARADSRSFSSNSRSRRRPTRSGLSVLVTTVDADTACPRLPSSMATTLLGSRTGDFLDASAHPQARRLPPPRRAFRRKTMITSLSTEERVAVARDYLARVFNGRNAERAREFFTPDVVWHGGALGTVTGVDTIVPVLGRFIGALTGIKAEVQDVIANKDLVALRLVVSATHTGNLLGIPATGRPVKWDALDIYRRTDDRKISRTRAVPGIAAILSQLGAAKLPWAG